MITRGSIGFRLNGKDYVTYNHSDSYPSCLGVSILKQAKGFAKDLEKTKQRVSKLVLVKENDKATPEHVDRTAKYHNLAVGSQSARDYYCLLRNAQGDLDKYLEVELMIDSSGFLADSLYCEWAYIINLDEGVLEVYKGFNRAANGKGRYAKLQTYEYYGVTLEKTYPLSKLPSEAKFLKDNE